MAFSLLNFVNEIGSLNPFWWFTKSRSQLRFRFFPDRKHKSFLGKKKIAKLNCSLVSIVILFAVRVRKNDSLISLFKHFLISQTTRDATDHDGIERPLPEQRLTTNSEKDGSKIRWLPQNPTYEN